MTVNLFALEKKLNLKTKNTLNTVMKVSIGMASKQSVESFIAVVNKTETAGE